MLDVVVPKIAVVLGWVKSLGKDLKPITRILRPTVSIQTPKSLSHNPVVRQCSGYARFTCAETFAVKKGGGGIPVLRDLCPQQTQ
jgi:hypothetical protein